MTEQLTGNSHVGVTLADGTEYPLWDVAFGENYYNVADGVDSIVVNQWDDGVLPFIHLMFHPDRQPGCTIDKIAAGDYDDLLNAWLLSLKAYCDTGRKAVVVYLPEFNGDWTVYGPSGHPDWTANPAAFIWSFNWMVLRARDFGIDSSMVKWAWAPNNYGWGSLSDWWPEPSLVDIVGMSAYNWGGLYPGYDWQSPRAILDPTVAEVRTFTDKPILITQTAAGLNDPRTPQWLSDLADYTLSNMIEGFIWFDIGEFRYGPGVEDFNARTAMLDSTRPDHWFQQEAPMPQHTSMLWLPDALRQAGVNVIELDGWDTAQGNYLWTDLESGAQSYEGEPTCFMIHHTAGTSANPEVKNSSGTWSKANCWAGLWRDGRLYQSGSGVPTVVFTSSGPARVSSGYGHGPTLHQVADEVRVPWDQPNSDTDMAANRYAWNVETVAAGDGSDIDPGVEHALIVMGSLLADRFGWSPWRTIGHLTWTKRKIDPYWDGRTDVIVRIQDAVAEMMGDIPTNPPDPTEPPEEPGEDMEDQGRNQLYVKQGMSGQDVEYWQVRIIQAVEGIAYHGNSNKTFIEAEGPASLVFKEWNQALTDYFSAWTQRNSYGIGATERVMVNEAIRKL